MRTVERMIPICVIGAGGLGRETVMVIEAINKLKATYTIVGFIDANQSLHNRMINGYRVLGDFEWIRKNQGEALRYVLGIGDPSSRRKVVAELRDTNIRYETLVHPNAVYSDHVNIGNGVVVTAGCIITVNIEIKDHVFLNLNTTVGHDAIIGPYCVINPSSCISGCVSIGEGANIGTGCKIINNITIGDWCTIGAGAVVIRDIPSYSTAVGVPAKVIKNSLTDPRATDK